MKLRVKKILATVAFGLLLSATYAQDDSTITPPWVSGKGYWVVESNVYDPQNNIIRFYNNANDLVYTETVPGVKLDIRKRKVKMKLKKALETTLLLCEQHKESGTISVDIAAILK
jgi:hypothetical protein